MKRSPNVMANWDLAADHSLAPIVQSFCVRCKASHNNLVAASSLGKWPRARTALRNLAFRASIALVV